MIRYTLKCENGHAFESWFASASAFDTLLKGGHVSCALCGSTKVEKALMAPAVASAEPAAPERPLSTPASPLEEKLAALRRQLEDNADYVGEDFASQARAMHLGEAPERSIWGEARPEEARALAEEGVPVVPLPLLRKPGGN